MTSSPTPDANGGGPPRRTPSDPHDRHRAMVAVEAQRLERTLRSIGPMPLDVLARTVDARHWREGTFQEAVREGVRQGRLRQLPLGWVEVPRS